MYWCDNRRRKGYSRLKGMLAFFGAGRAVSHAPDGAIATEAPTRHIIIGLCPTIQIASPQPRVPSNPFATHNFATPLHSQKTTTWLSTPRTTWPHLRPRDSRLARRRPLRNTRNSVRETAARAGPPSQLPFVHRGPRELGVGRLPTRRSKSTSAAHVT